jgi:hypothetical protein
VDYRSFIVLPLKGSSLVSFIDDELTVENTWIEKEQ